MTKDSIWGALAPEIGDIDTFTNQFVPELYLRPEVNADVVEDIRIIKKLIEHTYFEYKFFDVAALKAVTTMEMALKLRYKEVNSTEWPKKESLQKLFKWFEKNSYLEVYNSLYLDGLREIRNHLAHRHYHGFGGPSTLRIVENIVDLVNGLYEDTNLRAKRMQLTLDISNCLSSFGRGLRIITNQKTHLGYDAWVAFIDNKDPTLQFHFYYRPVYTLAPEYFEGSQWVYAPICYFQATSVAMAAGKLELVDAEENKLFITPITDPQEQDYFQAWWKQYQKISQPTGTSIVKNGKPIDSFTYHLRQFHRK